MWTIVTDRVSGGTLNASDDPVYAMPEKNQLASFAKAITRDQFGRFYWDANRETELKRSLISAITRVREERRARAKLAKKMSGKAHPL
jgi:hypothetical protein